MSSYTPQLVIPENGNPYYNRKATGGYNPCIYGNPQRRESGLNVLPNCTGYATGRFNEIGGYNACKYLGNTNACNYIDIARKQGLEISLEPKHGGCMVWKGGATGEGHVAIVELILGKRIVTSESEYYGKAFTLYQRFGSNWSDGCYWMGSSYTYLGCIVNPAVEEDDDMTRAETEKLIRDMFPDLMAAYNAVLAQMAPDAWAEPYIQRVKESGIMVGDPDGNFRPQSPIKREEMAAILANMLPDK